MPTGIYKRTRNHKNAISRGLSGHKLSKETKRKIGLANSVSLLGIRQSRETRKKRSETAKKVGVGLWMKGRKLPRKTLLKMRYARAGRNNPVWKGDGVKYSGLHMWVGRWRKKKGRCQMCKTTKAKKYEWANKSRKYKRNLEDWLELCVPCHRKYDSDVL